MYHYLSREVKQQIREAVKSGKYRDQVAKEFCIRNSTVCRLTLDLPNTKRYKRLTEEQKETARNLVKMGL